MTPTIDLDAIDPAEQKQTLIYILTRLYDTLARIEGLTAYQNGNLLLEDINRIALRTLRDISALLPKKEKEENEENEEIGNNWENWND